MEIQAVMKGERVPLPVEGGYYRQPVPVDGIVVSDGEETVFIPEKQARAALARLELRRRGETHAAVPPGPPSPPRPPPDKPVG